jgi:hypothetical protein
VVQEGGMEVEGQPQGQESKQDFLHRFSFRAVVLPAFERKLSIGV